ncbi:MAG: transporter substrate-binding domain-containing protein [Lachnospiraceae bacterium]|nr:transporter substrate-binding domain-containing protein [Lachnospiraceae bacterium]
MKKKKVAALLLSSLMAVSMLAGCGSSSSTSASSSEAEETEETTDETEEETTEEESAETSEEAAETEYAEDVQAIIDRGVLRVGVKNAVIGFGYQDELTGEYEGMEIELAQMIADYLGVDVEYTAVTAATRTELLDSGDIDCVLATFTITEERKNSWDFTTPYYTDYVTVLVENSSGITSLADLVDAKVGVSSGSTSAKSLTLAMIEGGYIDGTDYDADTFDAATWTTGRRRQS